MAFDLLLAHLFGDYIIQSHKMATRKSISSFWCAIHVLLYGIPFAFIPDITLLAWIIIVGTHFIIDRFSIAKYLIYFKNRLWEYQNLDECMSNFGYNKETPVWLSFFLYVVLDNTLHITINYYAYIYL